MYDEEFEKAILYHIIFEQYECDLNQDDFINSRNIKIINAINELKAEKKEISILSVKSKIKANSNQILEYISTLHEFALGTNADTLCNKIIELSKKRKIFRILQDNLKEIENSTIDVLSENIIKEINKINQRDDIQETFIEQLAKTAEAIENSYKNRNDYSLYTGIPDLDSKMLGLHNGEFTVIGARPGVGKTTFALQIAQRIAEKKRNVIIISLEMSETQMIQKMISKKSRVNTYRMRRGTLEENDWNKISLAIGEISNLPINLITNATNIQKIETVIRKLKNKNQADLVVIDYIQLIKNKSKFNNREQEVADITRTLKLLCLELNIPIIGLCQLNRNATKQEPSLADLRESGSIEQDADNVLFLYQEKEEETKSIVDITLKIAKQREGELGKVYLKFNKPNSEFIGTVRC